MSGKFPTSGIGSIALNLAAGSDDVGCEPLESAQIQQWVEYISMYCNQLQTAVVSSNILKELNNCLSRRTYIASNRKTVADIVIFFSLWNVIASLTFQEKEKYLNLSRWFNNIQNDEKIVDMCKQITFSRTLLY
ncbi:eukaryotic translation elongation factor 1 epsilon-1 isoform X2 [Nilaparvata lugens]|uniref:eukaryotic translation elongation factor 1 epsilon-1 isoform X2 n=1 Tax=Nilaparvata lugens TaxID=108931 RepID=UPI00193CD735|nr:eukaryotic translation elongation factor 1 epsilon-1 isoform X2 [Nilaparvata lugens]